ncbi:MAG: hypothetical protein KKF98_10465, partial [Bacteroidetes bacterium]|nr:hypothetical protein [Bacteroidota bacterium]
RITENDILLRNELVKDTASLLQYQQYLSYLYYKSLKSSADIERVISLTAGNQEFITSLNLAQTLDGYLTYLNIARADLLTALHVIQNPEMNNETPIIQYLNDAQNAASRIYTNEGIFLSYIDGIEAWLAAHPEQDNQNLKEAHDLLALNVLQSALIAQDKPLLIYLEDKKLYGDNQFLFTVLNDTIQQDEMLAFMELDNASIANFNAQSAQKIVKSVEQLNLVGSFFDQTILGIDTKLFNSEEKLGAGYSDQQKLGFRDQQKLGAINDQQKLGAINDQQKLGAINDQQKLGAINDQQKLGAINDQQKLGAINDQQKLGAILTNDQQKLGAINNQQTLGSVIRDIQTLSSTMGDHQSLGGVFQFDQHSLGSLVNDLQMINSQSLGSIGLFINSREALGAS